MTPREKRERPEFGIYFKIFKKTQDKHSKKSLCYQSLDSFTKTPLKIVVVFVAGFSKYLALTMAVKDAQKSAKTNTLYRKSYINNKFRNKSVFRCVTSI